MTALGLVLLVSACTAATPQTTMQPASEVALPSNSERVRQAESSVKQDESAASDAAAEKPELTLDLGGPEECECEVVEPPAPTLLELGFAGLADRQYVEAVQLFQRYRRQQDNPTARWESGIAIAYASMLSNSPLYDAEAARKSYRRLKKQLKPGMTPHQQTLLMSDALESFVVMDRHIADLQITTATLKEDLEKREEAIKRLRELTLSKGS